MRPLYHFLIRVVIFLAPLGVIYIAFVGLSIKSGEALPVPMAVERQRGGEIYLYGVTDLSTSFAFKLLSTKAIQPEVMVIGSSRALQFRREFFNRFDGRFYNASIPALNGQELEMFLSRIPAESFPRLVILSLDSLLYVTPIPFYTTADPNEFMSLNINDILSGHNRAMQRLFQGYVTLPDMLNPQENVYQAPVLGIRAVQVSSGFRPDGSLQRGDLVLDPSLALINDDVQQYDVALESDHMNEAEFVALDRALSIFAAHGTQVIGVLPPVSPRMYAHISSLQNNDNYLSVVPRLQSIFASHGYSLFDYSDPAQFGAQEIDFMDVLHPSELITLRMMAALTRAVPDTFGTFIDVDALESAQASARNTFEVFPYQGG